MLVASGAVERRRPGAGHAAQEYAAVTVPKIVNLPPFTPTAGRVMSQALGRLLTQVKAPGLKDMLPRLDPLSPADALKAFRIEKGFRVELVACEPDVFDPIALAFDEDRLEERIDVQQLADLLRFLTEK